MAVSAITFSSCGLNTKSYAVKPTNEHFTQPEVVGKIKDKEIIEASGITVSKCQPDVLWTHNDSGDDAFIYAVNPAGDDLGTWRVKNAQNIDWEDIAEYKDKSGKCLIYIGEIGNNQLERNVHTIYRVAEPQVTPQTANLKHKDALETLPADSLSFSYADVNQNAETLMVHPTTGEIYVLTKNRKGPSGVYRIVPTFNTSVVQKVNRLADIQVPSIPVGLLTGGDISPDGHHVVLCDYIDGYELVLPDDDNNFDDTWSQPITRINLGPRDTGEAVAYGNDGNSIFATTEGKNAPIIEIHRKTTN
jgi:hypothetical protein